MHPPEDAVSAAFDHYHAGDFAAAAKSCQAALKVNPRDRGALIILGLVALRVRRFGPAVNFLTGALQEGAEDAEIHYYLGEAYRGQGEFEHAEKAFRTASDITPEMAEAHAGLGRVLKVAGRFDEAEDARSHAVQLKAHELQANGGTQNMQAIADHFATVVNMGGPADNFEATGRDQLALLVQSGLNPTSKLLDIGCGCFRGGYWMMHYLQTGNYYGIEPDKGLVQFGKKHVLGTKMAKRCKPKVNSNDQFDFTVFDQRFDFYIAASIWNHATKDQIVHMLEGFQDTANDGAVMLASFLPAHNGFPDYEGSQWVGQSHIQFEDTVVAHRQEWIDEVAAARGLKVQTLGGNHEVELWLRMERA